MLGERVIVFFLSFFFHRFLLFLLSFSSCSIRVKYSSFSRARKAQSGCAFRIHPPTYFLDLDLVSNIS